MSKTIDSSKAKLLIDLLSIYQKEIEIIYAIGISWEQLKNEAKDKCAEDFDKALIARETLLEEVSELKDMGIKSDYYEYYLHSIDQILIEQSILVKEIYGLDIKSYLNVKQIKGLLK
jgi:hypothetical protein